MEKDDCIAIVGIACRFPGADDIDEYWELLKNGEDHVRTIPKERWDVEAINIQKLDNDWKPGAMWGGLIKDHDKFDNKFFGISNVEAGWMDPQQCLALEVAYSAIEDAGLSRQQLKGTNTGVYVGVMNRDFSLGVTEAAADFNNFSVTGIALSMISNLISYHFDIRGPSMIVDTACSSALVAVHLGCQSIKSGDCEMAICGGVNCILSPINNIALSKAQMISKTGKSHAFSSDADGYARGEGCGIVVLKNLKKARADGNKIWGIVMTGCNQDGRANSPITAPSGQQQKTLLKSIYAHHSISPLSVQYIEAHGTGTHIGDSTEINALADFFGEKLKRKQKLPIGSVKTNIGHLESSAGAAGLIKVLLMMKYGKVVPSLHYSKGKDNTNINFEQIPLEVTSQLCDWKTYDDGTRIGCVNSFGFGGTNSHAIIKQLAQVQRSTENETNTLSDFLITLSAATPMSLKNTAIHFQKKINTEIYDIQDLSFTSVRNREHFRYRIAFVAKTTSDLKTQISNTIDNFPVNLQGDTKKTKLIFLFGGVGTLWVEMCQNLLKTYSIFKKAAEEINKEIQKHGTFDIIETLKSPPTTFMTDSFVGPMVIFTCQMALFIMWQSLGISPNCIIGQYVGEVAAAYASGCLTLSEAVKVAYYRSLRSSKAKNGRMIVVGRCNISKIEEVCQSYGETLNIAVYTSKDTCVVSGSNVAINSLKETLSNNPEFLSVLLTDLNVTCAYHSQYMQEASEELEHDLRDLNGRPPTIKIISTVSGQEIHETEMGTAEYWSSNLRKPVLLLDAVRTAIDNDMKNIFLEIGPKPVIRAHLKMITDAEAESIPSCNSPDEGNTFVKAVAALYVHGIQVKIEPIAPCKGNLTDIPRYKFHRSGNLLASETMRATLKIAESFGKKHPFISTKLISHQFNVTLSIKNTPYIYEHMLDHKHIVPGALHAEIGLTVAKALSSIPLSESSICLQFLKPVFLDKRQTLELDVYVSKTEGSYQIKRKHDLVCTGKYFSSKTEYPVLVDIFRIKKQCPFYVNQQTFYKTLEDLGFKYGSTLTVIQNSWRAENEFIAELEVPNEIAMEMYTVNFHPCILDGALQTVSLLWTSMRHKLNLSTDISRLIPVKLGSLSVRRIAKRTMYVYGKLMLYTNDRVSINLLLVSIHGEVISEIENFEVKIVSPGHLTTPLKDISYKTRWLPVEIDYNARQTLDTSERTIFICLSKDVYVHCQTFTSTSYSAVILDVDTDTFESSKILAKLFKDIQSKHAKLNDIKDIIFVPGYDHSSEVLNTEEVYHCIKVSCLCLLILIQRLIKESIDIPILVVTKNTQPSVVTDKPKYNITGSELWGMCRSIIRERTYSNMRLIDISENDELQMLPVVIDNLKASDFWKTVPEFKFAEHKIYINQVVRMIDDSVVLRNKHYNGNEALELRSSNYKKLENFFFIPKPPLSHGNSNYCSLKVETALANLELSPITTTLATEDPDPWKADRSDGHEIFATELCGKIDGEQEPYLRSKNIFPENNLLQENISYLSCFPCNVSNNVRVPVSCLINKNDFPQYKPGIMHESIWYFRLLEELTAPLGVIYDEELTFDLDLMQAILGSKGHKIVFSCTFDTFRENNKISGKIQLLLLTKNVLSIKDCFGKIADISSKIITFSQLVSKAEERLLRQQLPGIQICIINNDDMFSEHRLPELVILLKSWLAEKPVIKLKINTKELNNEILFTFIEDARHVKMINCKYIPVRTEQRYLFSKSAGYIIVGGLSGLGWETVKLIARMGGGCVTILSRQQPSEQRKKEMDDLSSEYDCKIIALKADVSEIGSLSNAFESFKRECQGFYLRGIFQGAAVVEDALIVNMTEEKFEKVLKPKIKGTMNLHMLTKDMKLDFFVLHSSITSVFGNTGQSNYGAGNAFMDTFAYYRRTLGLCGQTINWGVLHLGIIIASEHVEKHLNSEGYESMQPSDVMECLVHTLCSDLPQLIYGIFKWETIFRKSPDMVLYSKLKPILTELNLPDIYLPKEGQKIIVDFEELHALSVEKRQEKISNVLVLIAADIFGVEESMVKTETKFSQFGMDSMKAMALTDKIFEHFSFRIQVIDILDDNANIESIITSIVNQITHLSDITGIVLDTK